MRAPILYMVIDTTTVEQTIIRFVADNKRAALLGQTYMLEHPGRKCVAPMVESKSFSKLDKLALQYLFWNTFKEKPSEEYGTLLLETLKRTLKMEPNVSEIGALEAGKVMAEVSVPNPDKPVKAKATPKEANATPKTTSTCGLVWDICDKQFALLNVDITDKSLRAAIMAACENEGVNKSTSAVQYGKWKNQKSSVNT